MTQQVTPSHILLTVWTPDNTLASGSFPQGNSLVSDHLYNFQVVGLYLLDPFIYIESDYFITQNSYFLRHPVFMADCFRDKNFPVPTEYFSTTSAAVGAELVLGTGLLGGLDSLGLILLPSWDGSLLLFSLWVGGGGVAKIAVINTCIMFCNYLE